ncbi:MAG: carboxypeptidase M32 [Candidatus Uhrbacteria bacterium]|nr:carboxypeptidase M32 [Candidatus Uhrbacteria bacterium]
MQTKFSQLKNTLAELTHLSSATALLHWDMETHMPREGAAVRGKTISLLSALVHERFTSPEFETLVTELNEARLAGVLDDETACVVREIWRDFSREKKLPKEFVEELSQTTSDAHHIWADAKKKSDFSLFSPVLEKIISLKRKQADYYGYVRSPYDALLDGFEQDTTLQDIDPLFEDLKKFLVPLIKNIGSAGAQPKEDLFYGDFDISKQQTLCRDVLKLIDFSFEKGRLDEAAHPFTQGFHPSDVRITTRYDQHNVFYSLLSTIHEAGHAFYDMGLSDEHFGTPLAESLSLGIHESQSRLWENHIGRGRSFWIYMYPRLQTVFPKPFGDISFDDFNIHLNRVTPSLIRTESDEVTYNLHIIIRLEIEREIIEGALDVENIPEVWNQKVKQYFGIDVFDDAHGCLQDVHWSGGMFGYFPTYTLGNLYAAQLYAAASRDILNLEEEISRGSFGHLREWLRTRIHVHGRRYAQDALIQNATGEKLNAQHFVDYISKKYSK